MNPFLCVYGHVCLDQILTLDKFPDPNTSVDLLEKHRYYGGTGANVAAVAASLGVPTALCSFVGPDFPQDFREFLVSKGVDLSEVVAVEGYETSTVLIVTNKDQDQIAYVYQGPMRDMGKFERSMEGAKKAKRVHISTGRPEYYIPLMRELKALGKRISFDPAQEIYRIWDRATFREALPLADTFFCNKNELRAALEYMGASRPEDLLSYVDALINTRGGEGSLLCTGKGSRRAPPAKPEKIVDPTGAGDAFRAGFYAGQYYGHDAVESLAYGNAAASFVLESKGPQTNIPTWEMVERRAESVLAALER
jgi:sugar/nucleoside kinase (ribokinase family)